MHGQQVWIIWFELTMSLMQILPTNTFICIVVAVNYKILHKSFGTFILTITQPFQSFRKMLNNKIII